MSRGSNTHTLPATLALQKCPLILENQGRKGPALTLREGTALHSTDSEATTCNGPVTCLGSCQALRLGPPQTFPLWPVSESAGQDHGVCASQPSATTSRKGEWWLMSAILTLSGLRQEDHHTEEPVSRDTNQTITTKQTNNKTGNG